MSATWQPDDWRQLPAIQMPQYADSMALEETRARHSQSAPLVFAARPIN